MFCPFLSESETCSSANKTVEQFIVAEFHNLFHDLFLQNLISQFIVAEFIFTIYHAEFYFTNNASCAIHNFFLPTQPKTSSNNSGLMIDIFHRGMYK